MSKKTKFSIVHKDKIIVELVAITNHRILGIWALDCTKRVLSYFEDKYPEDNRPRKALQTLQSWIDTGEFSMKIIRRASLDSHAAAREVGENNSARSAARAAGQAVATAHVPTHSIGAANYALQAIYREHENANFEEELAKERKWQKNHLIQLKNKSEKGE